MKQQKDSLKPLNFTNRNGYKLIPNYYQEAEIEKRIPAQYNQLMPYLTLKDAKKFKEFMESAFEATEQLTMPGKDGTIIHGELRIGQAVLMYADVGAHFL